VSETDTRLSSSINDLTAALWTDRHSEGAKSENRENMYRLNSKGEKENNITNKYSNNELGRPVFLRSECKS